VMDTVYAEFMGNTPQTHPHDYQRTVALPLSRGGFAARKVSGLIGLPSIPRETTERHHRRTDLVPVLRSKLDVLASSRGDRPAKRKRWCLYGASVA